VAASLRVPGKRKRNRRMSWKHRQIMVALSSPEMRERGSATYKATRRVVARPEVKLTLKNKRGVRGVYQRGTALIELIRKPG